jgi:glycosyltransferase involved in cell wall biosynthesis
MGPLTVYHTEASMGWGGQEIRILTEMTALRDRGYALGVIAQPGAAIAARAAAAGFPVHTVRMRGACDLPASARVAAILRSARPHLLNTHSSVDAWVGGWAARWMKIPVIRTRHLAIRLRRNPLSPRVYTWMADHVVTTGEAGRDLLVAQAGLDPARVTVVPTGVDVQRFSPERADGESLRAELRLPPATSIVGVVAVLRARKGHGVLLEALQHDALATRPICAVFAGAGPMEGRLRERAGALGVAGRVHFLGQREDVPDILAASRVVVLPATADEGVPQAILQAFAMGRPVVASDVSGVRQVVLQRETGILVPPGNAPRLAAAIAELLDRPELAFRLGQAARRLACSRFSLGRMADDMEAVYSRVLGEERKR